MIAAAVLIPIAALACQPDPGATRESREANVVAMRDQAAKTKTNLTFDAGGIEARTLVIHSSDEQALSDDARCQLSREGFVTIVNVYESHYRIWEIGK